MGADTKIEWAHHTFNPWYGCQKVGPGCDHCYAEGWAKRSGLVQWGPDAERRRSSPANWRQPVAWNRRAQVAEDAWQCGLDLAGGDEKELLARGFVKPTRPRVFCASLADVFDNAVPAAWRADLFRLIEDTPYLDWMLLTKRIGNVGPMMFAARGGHLPLLPNVWIGATIVNQEEADRDIPKLLATPAAVRFLSMEPLLGPVDLQAAYLPCPNSEGMQMDPETGTYECCRRCDYTGISSEMGIDWVIVGGESGHGARPMHPEWARSLRDQCAVAGVPFLFKQWGEFASAKGYPGHMEIDHVFDDLYQMVRVGKNVAGRLLDGVQHDGYPESAA